MDFLLQLVNGSLSFRGETCVFVRVHITSGCIAVTSTKNEQSARDDEKIKKLIW